MHNLTEEQIQYIDDRFATTPNKKQYSLKWPHPHEAYMAFVASWLSKELNSPERVLEYYYYLKDNKIFGLACSSIEEATILQNSDVIFSNFVLVDRQNNHMPVELPLDFSDMPNIFVSSENKFKYGYEITSNTEAAYITGKYKGYHKLQNVSPIKLFKFAISKPNQLIGFNSIEEAYAILPKTVDKSKIIDYTKEIL